MNTINKEVVISPIFYMGNKKKLISKGLTDLFPKDIDVFYDLFSGSGVVSINSNANKYIINDINKYLYDLYNLFKTNDSEGIINHIENRIDEFGLARERTKRNEYLDKKKIEEYKLAYSNFRNLYNENKNVFDFYTLMFYSFSQQFRFGKNGKFNMPCGNDCFSEKNKDYIVNGCNFFSKPSVNIYSHSYEYILEKYPPHVNDFVYLDPPYLNTTATYNENNGWSKEDELKLYSVCEDLNKNNIRFAMSNVFENKGIINTNLIEWCEKNNFKVYDFKNFSYTACGKGNSNAKEVLITNY